MSSKRKGMRSKISQILGLLCLSLLTVPAQASFVYVPFDQLLAEAELIVTGVIIDKKYVKKESEMGILEHNPISGERIIRYSTYMGQFTDYQLQVDEIIKGSTNSDVLNIDAIGGCEDEICVTDSSSYSYEIGDRVFILLKKRTDRPFYQSTRQGYTAYFLSEDGRIYRHPDELEIINGAGFERSPQPEPETLEEIKAMLETADTIR